MAIIVNTHRPRALVARLKEGIAGGLVDTWEVDADGDFSLSAEQWRYKAWFRPVIHENAAVFRIFPPRQAVMSKSVYAVYHARFIEMLLRHFDEQFDGVRATALPAFGDVVRTPIKTGQPA